MLKDAEEAVMTLEHAECDFTVDEALPYLASSTFSALHSIVGNSKLYQK